MGDQTMISLTRYKVVCENGFTYFQSNLADTNTLSSMLLELINFKKGEFFTLLPTDVDKSKINEFRLGGIARGVRDQISSVIWNKLHLDNRLCCVFDDVTSNFEAGYSDPLFNFCGFVYQKEIYYLVDQQIASIELINRCFQNSNAIWHSLCVLTEIDLTERKDKNSKVLNLIDIKQICFCAKLVIIGAYDGEGYICWEKQGNVVNNSL
jgi:hypothetical protein